MEDNKCSFEDCDLERYEGHDKCILHCEKDSINDLDYMDFLNTLRQYIVDRKYKNRCIFRDVQFPKFVKIEDFKIFNDLECEFNDCVFNDGIEYLDQDCEFYNCVFNERIIFYPANIEIFFIDCIFNGNVVLNNFRHFLAKKLPSFQACNFAGVLLCINITELQDLFCNSTMPEKDFFIPNQRIYKLYLSRCRTQKRIILKDTETLIVKDCFFDTNVVIESQNLSKLSINSTHITGDFKIKSVKSLSICKMKNLNIDGSFTMTDCVVENKPVIQSIYSRAYISITQSEFMSELDLSEMDYNSNFIISPDVKINVNMINKLTCQIIKHSFDRLGNTLGANKYFALEMKKAYEELSWKKDTADKLLMFVNRITSDYGQKWWLALGWICGLNIIMTIGYYVIHPDKSLMKQNGLVILDRFAQFVLPTSIFNQGMASGHSFINLIVGAVNGILLYQLIVALKRKTRR